MRWWLILLTTVLLSSVAIADVKVDTFQAFLNNENLNVDWEDDIIKVQQKSTLELQVKFYNNLTQQTTLSVEATLSGFGSDIVRNKELTIPSESKKSTVLEFYIPEDAKQTIYDLEIEYRYQDVNGTNVVKVKTFELQVQKYTASSEDVLVNLTQAIVLEKDKSNNLMYQILNLSTMAEKYAQCSSQLSGLSVERNISQVYLEKYDNEKSRAESLSTELASCSATKTSMYTLNDIEQAKKEGASKQQGDDWNVIMFAGIGAGLYWWWNNRKKNVGGGGLGQPLTGKW